MRKPFKILGAFVAAFVLLVALAHFGALEDFDLGPAAQKRDRRSRALSDMRSLAFALENYRADAGAYPDGISLAERARQLGVALPEGGERLLTLPASLTTPVAYLTSVLADVQVEKESRGLPFAYYADGGGWMLISVGPDGDYDLKLPETAYDSSIPQPSALLQGGPWTFDPTNGMTSSGDVWRVKQ